MVSACATSVALKTAMVAMPFSGCSLRARQRDKPLRCSFSPATMAGRWRARRLGLREFESGLRTRI